MMIRAMTDEDLTETLRWYDLQGEPAPARDWFVGIGLIVPDVCAGFLYVAGRRGYLEDIVTNPEATGAMRRDGLIQLVREAEKTAQFHGVVYLVGWSRETTVARRAVACGYVEIGNFQGFAKRVGE